ncbi:MAG: carboxypeptidase regulatory-like domain-containing protein, partial [Bryobacterales bacterium]|nr:carboxypeptidase regulatory-like domain-containing protein [Bryobacterales bacterium]
MKSSRALLAVAACLFGVAFSQERTGKIEGLVTDPSGSAVPLAEVEVSGPALPQAQKTKTDGAGAYLFPSLPPGTYAVSVKAQGFSQFKASNVLLNVGRTIRVDARMEVGAVSESVVVSGEVLLVDTANTTVQTNVTAELYDKLPKGRSFDSLIVMAPGVRREPKSGGFQVDGSSGSENSFVVDGIEVTSIQTGELTRQSKVPIEWISETNVKSSGFDAQYGGAIGGVVAATTRSGGNEFHGQASLYLMTDGMNAGLASPIVGDRRASLRLNPVDDAIGEYFFNKKDGYRMLNPGFRVGGPIKKDMVWFFLSAYPEFHNIDRTVTYLRPVETRSYTRKDRQDFTLAKIDLQPFSKLRTNFSYFYNPYKVNGLLPTYQGTDAITTPWADRGLRRPATGFGYQADYTVTSKLAASVFGGYQYNNNKDYGIPRGTRYRYANGNAAVAGVPSNLIGPAGNFTPDNRQTVQDIFT